VKRVLVRAGSRGAGLVQLIQGPPQGSRVVANAGALMLDGDLVRPVEAGAAAAPAAKTAARK
jgi:HlyD family secretion protein